MPSDRTSKLFVTKFPRNYNDKDLEDLFDRYGTIRNVSVKEGYGFVEYDDYKDAQKAIKKLDGKSIQG